MYFADLRNYGHILLSTFYCELFNPGGNNNDAYKENK